MLDWSKHSARIRNYRIWVITAWRRNGCWGGDRRGNDKKKRTNKSFLHCEPERDPVHHLQSIHITLLGKNIIPDEMQQLTTSLQSQCRVLPALLQLPSGSCRQQGWSLQPGPLTPSRHAESLTPITQDGFGEMSSHSSSHNTGRCFPPARCSIPLPQAAAQEQSRLCTEAVPAQNVAPWPQLQRSWCVPEREAYFNLF